MPETVFGAGPWMWGSHVAAALLTIVVLVHGERTLLAVARFAFFVLRRFVDRVAAVRAAPLPRPCASRLETTRALRRLDPVLDGRRRRGPPPAFIPAG
jgi:hypothetical protein